MSGIDGLEPVAVFVVADDASDLLDLTGAAAAREKDHQIDRLGDQSAGGCHGDLENQLLQAQQRAQAELSEMEVQASSAYAQAQRAQELRVFGYRLALTLPLLVLAGYLFKKHRKGSSWPFVWGFIFFALFAFFVELVPYLPSYGGYVRYIVGIVLTVIGGRYAIRALQRYLERQKLAEALPAQTRQREMDYDQAQARMTKNICPGCERTVDMKDGKTDFCPHCGLCLFDHCGHCSTRKNAFARYCYSCGASAKEPVGEPGNASEVLLPKEPDSAAAA